MAQTYSDISYGRQTIITKSELIELCSSVGKDVTIEYLRYLGSAQYVPCVDPGKPASVVPSCASVEPLSSQSSTSSAPPASLPTPVSSTRMSTRTSFSQKTSSELLSYRNKSGYCYSAILKENFFLRRIGVIRSWPNFVTMLRLSYSDTVGLEKMEAFYLKPVDDRGRFHLTTEITLLPLLNTLYTLSCEFSQRPGTLGYAIHNMRSSECIELLYDVALSSKVGGTSGDSGGVGATVEHILVPPRLGWGKAVESLYMEVAGLLTIAIRDSPKFLNSDVCTQFMLIRSVVSTSDMPGIPLIKIVHECLAALYHMLKFMSYTVSVEAAVVSFESQMLTSDGRVSNIDFGNKSHTSMSITSKLRTFFANMRRKTSVLTVNQSELPKDIARVIELAAVQHDMATLPELESSVRSELPVSDSVSELYQGELPTVEIHDHVLGRLQVHKFSNMR